jgi:hypothetical protein
MFGRRVWGGLGGAHDSSCLDGDHGDAGVENCSESEKTGATQDPGPNDEIDRFTARKAHEPRI